ncbi:MAG: rhodanese-like domain-containing protein [Eubacterium sp.]|nr:rhodanese-like domain-containing protein [Eubacterium sp.]
MGLIHKLFHNNEDINSLLAKCRAENNAYLIDVRTTGEYAAGHIEGSINIPLADIHQTVNYVKTLDAPVYVYCRSGARAGQATSMIREMGYRKVINMGGILDYKGDLVK